MKKVLYPCTVLRFALLALVITISPKSVFSQCYLAAETSVNLSNPTGCLSGTAMLGSGAYYDLTILTNTYYDFSWSNNGATCLNGYCLNPQNGIGSSGAVSATTSATNAWYSGTTNLLRISANRSSGTWCWTSGILTYRYSTPSISSATASPDPICVGATLSLAVSAVRANGYSWNGPNGFSSSTQNPTRANISTADGGFYTVVATNSGCTASATTNVLSVNINPSVAIQVSETSGTTSNDGITCSGDAVTLNAINGDTYNWSGGLGSGNPKNVSPASTITYTVTGTNTTTGCSASASRTITVNSLPTPGTSVSETSGTTNNDGTTCNGDPVSITASGGTSYLWNTGSSSNPLSVSPSSTTTYSVTVTNVNNCSATTSRTITVNPLPTPGITVAETSGTTNNDGITCSGATVTLTGTGGTSYSWNNGLGAGNPKTPAPTTTTSYVVTVTNANNCSATASTTITVNPAPSPSITVTETSGTTNNDAITCSGDQVTLTASGGTSYNWNNGLGAGNPKTPSPVSTTTYIVTATDANVCSATAQTIVTVNPLPTDITPVATALSVCSGTSTTIQIAGSQVGVTYYLRDNSNNSVVSSLPGTGGTIFLSTGNLTSATTFNVYATSSANCSRQMSTLVTITVDALSIIPTGATATSPVCLGQSTTLTQVGGTLGLGASWEWYSSACGGTPVGTGSPLVVSPTSAGSITYFVRAEGTCNTTSCVSVTVTVRDTSKPATSVTGTSPVCNGTGTTVSLSGGSLGDGASWNWYSGSCGGTAITSGVTSINVTPTATTTYFARAEGTCNNTACQSFTVVVNPLPQGNISGTTSICNGASTNITFNFTVGTGPFDIQYTDGTSIFSANGVNNGDFVTVSPITTTTYTFTQITDANTCVRTSGFSGGATVTVTPLPVINSVTPTDVLCNGDNTGTIIISASSGTPPFSYSIDNGVTFPYTLSTVTGLYAGNYDVVVKDQQGCIRVYAFNSVTVSEPSPLVHTTTTQDASCANVFDGKIDVFASGGVPPYEYSLNGGPTQAGSQFTGLQSGIYVVYVYDDNGCVDTSHIAINESYNVSGFISAQTNVSCYGGSDGSVTVQIVGGVPAYSYSINGSIFGASNTFTGLTSGNYVATLRDSKGCTAFVPVAITQPLQLSVTVDAANSATCYGTGTGEIFITVNGGTSPYSYLWSNAATTEDISGLTAGTYTATITDSKGCVAYTSATISQPLQLVVQLASFQNLKCNGDNSGKVDISVSGGIPPYNYTWSNGASSEDLNNVAAGTYTVTVLDFNGCSQTLTQTITQPAVLGSTIETDDLLCNGLTNGGIDLNVYGGTTPYSYLWNNGATTQDLTGIGAGTYSVLVYDANNCTTTNSVTIGQPAALGLSVSVTNIACSGNTTGGVDLTVTGGTPAYNYLWSNTATTEDLTNVAAGTYTVSVTDDNGCSASISAILTQPVQSLNGSLSPTDVTCFGFNNGNVNLTISGGTTPYTFAWSNAATTEDISGLGPNNYSVTVTDYNLCSFTGTATVNEPAQLTASISGTPVSCNGGNDGAADLTVGGGNPGYTYLWSNFATSEDLSGLTAGNYVVVVTDTKSCSVTSGVSITQPAALVLSAVVTNVSCNAGTDGAIDLTITGGNSQLYDILWSNTSTNEDQSGLSAGTYTVTVTDGNLCTATASYVVTEPLFLSLTGIATDVTCNGNANGTVNITVGGGTTPYSFVWSNTATTEDLNGLSGGTYSVTVTDFKGCTNSASFTVNEPAQLTASIVGTNVSCYGGNNGAADLTVGGGNPGYTYLWSNFATSEDLSGLVAGNYVVIVTDTKSCSVTAGVSITQPAALGISGSVTNVSCNGNADGAIDITVTGGTPSYSFTWSNTATSEDLTLLTAGNYSVTVLDGNVCSASASFTVTENAPLTITSVVTPINCNGGNGGAINITVTGGAQPYSFSWSNSATTEDISGLIAGPYSVVVTDANFCTATAFFTITQPNVLTSTILGTNVTCNGAADGAADLTVSGGTTPYTFLWSNFQNSEDVSGLSGGMHFVIITDANNCTRRDSIQILEPTAITTSVTVTNISCNGGTADVDLTVSGGTPGYTYLWSNSATTEDLTGVVAGTYTVTITDNNDCTATATATVTQPTAIAIVLAGQNNVSCFGGNNGSIDINVFGGTPLYSYAWSNSATTEDLNALTVGTYSVVVTDANSCTATFSTTISEPTAITSSIIKTDVTCPGAANGSADLTVGGGVPGYTFLWSNGATTEDLSGVTGGTYTVIITDNNGCTAGNSVVILEGLPLTITGAVTDVLCNGGATGAITISVSGGNIPYGFLWSNSATTQNISGLTAGTYTVTVNDLNNCTASSSFTVSQPAAIVISATTLNVGCAGGNNGLIDITVYGGVFPYTYAWTGGATSEDLHNISGGTYTVTVTDANVCTATSTYTISEPSAITSSIVKTDLLCFGDASGTADLTVSGGTSPYSFLWSTFQSIEDLSGLSGGTYYVIITDANGCVKRDSTVIIEPLALQLSTSVTNVQCNGGNGSINLTVTGGTPGYTYLWSNAATTQNLSSVSAGTYSVTVTDNNLCKATISATITQPTPLVLTGTKVDVSCNGGNNGSVNIQVSGSVIPYTYLWSNTATTEDVSGLIAGTYTVTATDANTCTATGSFIISEPTAITSSISKTDVDCHGAANATATLTVGGGTPAYTFNWSNFSGSQNQNGLSGGTYYVIITDANGCTKRDSIVIAEPTAILLSATTTAATCNGSLNGAVDISVSGGTPGYSYLWDNAATTQDLNAVAGGTYCVTVTDDNACTATICATVAEPNALALSGTKIDATCAGGINGSINLSVLGGVLPYTFLWSNAATTEDLFGLTTGTYDVTVTDANGCSGTTSFTISSPPGITSSVAGTNVTCNNANNGSATLTVGGGTPPYNFLWSTFEGTQNIANLDGGVYYVLITDNAGCTHRDSIIITEPSQLLITETHNDITCFNFNNGNIDVTVTGGTPAYTYLWSANANSVTTQDVSNLAGGLYGVTVTDNSGCTTSTSVLIANPSLLTANHFIANANCFGDANGSIDLIPTGGTPTYTYVWTNSATTEDVSGLSAGTYTVTITDAKGCTATNTSVITEPAPLVTSGITKHVSCFGYSDGFVDITGYGGTLPYSFQWSTGASTEDVVMLPGGNYLVTVTDAHNCQVVSLYEVREPTLLTVDAVGTNVSCNGLADGSIAAIPGGGVTPYEYVWDDFNTDSSRIVPAGHYIIQLIDSNGCHVFDFVEVTEPSPIIVTGIVTNVTCNGGSSGAIDITVIGGTPTYTFGWSHGPTAEDLTGLSAGMYAVTVTDANICSVSKTFDITEPDAIVLQFITNKPSCHGTHNGSVSVFASQGVPGYTYAWNTTPVQTTATADNVGGGNYVVVVTDASSCSVSGSIDLADPDSITVTTVTTGSKCLASATGTVTATVTGGEAPYIYQLNGVAQNTPVFTNLGPGNYMIIATDANGCAGTDAFSIASPSDISVMLSTTENVILTGMQTQLFADVTSLLPVINIFWSPDSLVDFSSCSDPDNCSSPYVHPASTTTFTVIAMNSDSCQAVDTITITVVNNHSMFIPTAFTPNGDGMNDRFEFDILGVDNIEVSIFNRWGERIYFNPAQPNGITGSNGWDGTVHGKYAPDDTYVYLLKLLYFDNTTTDINGTVTIMR